MCWEILEHLIADKNMFMQGELETETNLCVQNVFC